MSDAPEMSDEFRKQLAEMLEASVLAEIVDEEFYYALVGQAGEGDLNAQLTLANIFDDENDNAIISGADALQSAKWVNMAAAQGHVPSIQRLMNIADMASDRLRKSADNSDVDIPLFEYREGALEYARAHGMDPHNLYGSTPEHSDENALS